MTYDFSQFDGDARRVKEWLEHEYSLLNVGRASPAVLDSVRFEAYGAMTAVNHTSNITIEDPRTLLVSPWDKSQIKDIEKAILAANLGLSVSAGDTGVRVVFPQLTTERRTDLVKVLKDKLEDARVSLRAEREKVWERIQNLESEGAMSEDDKFRAKDELQKKVEAGNAALQAVFEKKEKEVLG